MKVIRRVKELKELVNRLSDDATIKLVVKNVLDEEELEKMVDPCPYKKTFFTNIGMEVNDFGRDSEELCFEVEIPGD